MQTRWLTEHISAVPTDPEESRFFVKDHRNGFEKTMEREEIARYVRETSRSEDHLPVGDWVHGALDRLGFEGCLSCAERQAKLNRLIPKRKS